MKPSSRSPSVENYLKEIFNLRQDTSEPITTNELAGILGTSAASVTGMLQKLALNDFIRYRKYKGVTLTGKGKCEAAAIVRRHRLWEKFLVEKLGFGWEEVHEMAEQLEHVKSEKLIQRLDRYMNHPQYDPHGDPIPDESGKMAVRETIVLSDLAIAMSGVVSGVTDHSKEFLKYMDKLGIAPGTFVSVTERMPYDHSLKIALDKKRITVFISNETAGHILIIKKNEGIKHKHSGHGK